MNSFVSKPPECTLILENLPKEIDHWLIGIDTQFFNVNSLLKGIKLIPRGIHLFHYSTNFMDDHKPRGYSGMLDATCPSFRYGFWFEARENDVLVLYWQEDSESCVIIDEHNELERLNYTKVLSNLGDTYLYMLKYPQDEQSWKTLTRYIDEQTNAVILPQCNGYGQIDTMMSSKEEFLALAHQLSQKGNSIEENGDDLLLYSIVQFKLNRSKSQTVEQTTRNYLDKSWYLEELFNESLQNYLGELQLSFLNFIIICNTCSNVQWLNLLKLCLMSQTTLLCNKKFTGDFLLTLRAQLAIIPEDYLTINPLVDVKHYIEVMEKFANDTFRTDLWHKGDQQTQHILQIWDNILALNTERFGLNFQTKVPIVDENMTEVFSINDYDPEDENAPVILT